MSELDPRTGLPKTKTPAYNPRAYVPGGAPTNVAQATQAQGFGVPYTGVGSHGVSPRAFTVPGFRPDYKSLIGSDPIFGQLKMDLSAGGIADAAARAAATARAVTQFGIVPDFNQLSGLNQGFLNADITPEARMLAQRNTEAGLSISARQQKQLRDNIRLIKNQLAARGALRSGEAGHQLGEAQQDFDRQSFDSTQELMDYIAGVQAGFAQAERARQAQLSQGAQQAAVTQAQLNPAQPDQQAQFDPVTGLYRTADGRLFNTDGSPAQAPPPVAPPAAPALPDKAGLDPLAALMQRMGGGGGRPMQVL